MFRVVYIDDEDLLCENFHDYFQSNEVEVTTFSETASALEYITKQGADLIFIDYRLPSMNGDQLAQHLPKEIPKVLVTGEITVKTHYKFDQVISKPFKIEQITATIKSYSRPNDPAPL
jgi:DNA-binding NtrC family response regulator